MEREARESKFRRICVFCGSSQGKKSSYQAAAIELGRELLALYARKMVEMGGVGMHVGIVYFALFTVSNCIPVALWTCSILIMGLLQRLEGFATVSRNIDLVYGGGSVGLMGLISQAVYDGGRHVIGVIPKTLMPRELLSLAPEDKDGANSGVVLELHLHSAIVTCQLRLVGQLNPHHKKITGETVGEVKAVADMHQRKAEMARQSDAFIALPGSLIKGGYGTLEELLEVIAWAQLGIHDKPVGLLNVDGYYNSLLSFIDKAVEEGFVSPNARHIIVSAPTPKELVKKLEEYVPCHEIVASKLSWEMERLGYSSKRQFLGGGDEWKLAMGKPDRQVFTAMVPRNSFCKVQQRCFGE
ncbi:hypothetical protein ACLOJK_011508 [Asimina triloba]